MSCAPASCGLVNLPRRARLLSGLCLGLLITAGTTAQEAADTRQTRADPSAAVHTMLEAQRTASGFPGASLAWFGGQDRQGKVAVGELTPDQRLMSGSIGKTYVAALALRLVADGKLGLDEPAKQHLDADWLSRVPNGDKVTIRQLLRHQSGIPEHVWMPEFEKALRADLRRTWAPHELLSFVFDKPAKFAPGEGWEYADTNYVLVGAVLEKVGAAPCFEQIHTRLLAPLQLADTVANTSPQIERLANGHTSGLLGLTRGDTVREGRCVVNPQFEYCGGGLSSTPSDLARWGYQLFAGDVVAEPLRKQHRDGVPSKTGRGHRYGLGVMLIDTPHGPALGHSGVMVGYLSMLLYYERLDLAVAVQFNTDDQRKLGQGLQKYLDTAAGLVAGR